jgi:adenylate kinase
LYLILLGLPGAGKGTQASRLKESTGLAHISSGDLFRENIGQGTELGRKAKEYVDQGALVPDEITIAMILDRIGRPDAERGFMLDGFPRTMQQAEALDEALGRRGKQIDRAVYIRVSTEELVRRLAGRWTCPKCQAVYHEVNQPPNSAGVCDNCGSALTQREDDKPDVVRKRIEIQLENLTPLVRYYGDQGKLVEVEGERGPDAVTSDIAGALEG